MITCLKNPGAKEERPWGSFSMHSKVLKRTSGRAPQW